MRAVCLISKYPYTHRVFSGKWRGKRQRRPVLHLRRREKEDSIPMKRGIHIIGMAAEEAQKSAGKRRQFITLAVFAVVQTWCCSEFQQRLWTKVNGESGEMDI